MFEQIKLMLKDISSLPNIYVIQNQEYVKDTWNALETDDFYLKLSFTIIQTQDYIPITLYKACCKENNPNCYLKIILNDLTKIKSKFFKGGNYEIRRY